MTSKWAWVVASQCQPWLASVNAWESSLDPECKAKDLAVPEEVATVVQDDDYQKRYNNLKLDKNLGARLRA